MKETLAIANFVNSTEYESIPAEARQIARMAVLDWFGVTLGGFAEPAPRILSEQARRLGANKEAGVIGHNFRTSADSAAWINGAASHALDYDDTFAIAAGYNMHPTVPVLPAVLALGEKCQASGRDILTAYIIGVEVESRLGSIIGNYNTELGWHPTPVLGTIGASVAASKILKLDLRKIQTALGIASSMAGGLTRNFGTMTKPFHAGNAARNGVLAAQLARSGFTADPNLLEGKFGYLDIFSGGKVIEPAASRLGERWDMISQGMVFKPYPCCRGTHSSIDAVLHLRDHFDIPPDQVDTIICKTRSTTRRSLKYDRPHTGLEAKFSVQYCIAAALIRGKISLADFNEEKVNELAVQGLIPKVSYAHPPELEDSFSLTQEIVIKMNDGREFAHKVVAPKGEPENPLNESELQAKFKDCAQKYLPPKKIDIVLDILTRVDSLDTISTLMDLVTSGID